ISVIEDQTARIHAITRYIDLVRGTKAFSERYMAKLRLGDVVNRAIKSLKLGTNTSDVFFKYQDQSAFTRGNRELVEQAIVNVLKNAVEAIHETSRKHGTVIIRLTAAKDSDTVSLDIIDNGCGIGVPMSHL